MAPGIEHAVATVVSTQVTSSDGRDILVEAGGFTPMNWFLEHANDAVAQDAEPPRKRQKLGSSGRRGEGRARGRQDVDDNTERIPLRNITIDLHFPDGLQADAVSADVVNKDVSFADVEEVQVINNDRYGFQSSGNGCSLRLGACKANFEIRIETGALSAEITDSSKQEVPLGLALRATLGYKASSHPATELRCTLARSKGGLHTVVRLKVTLLWRSGHSGIGRSAYQDHGLLAQLYPDVFTAEFNRIHSWTPQDFYESVHVADKSAADESVEDRCADVLEAELYPFQKRAVTWMLRREGVRWDDSTPGQLVDLTAEEREQDRIQFSEPLTDLNGRGCYINRLTAVVSRAREEGHHLLGGLLAEEMGLGKTVELMALISLHVRQDCGSAPMLDLDTGTQATPSRATLVITPLSILQQWKSELSRHAPKLKVFHYEGIPSSHKKSKADADIVRDLATNYDVVLATYHTLGKEVHHAEDPPDRNMRRAPKHERRKSPLVQIQWWRICLDEAQMVESGVSAAARVACRLPRVNSWAVSGTPLRKSVQDLHGLLIFLHVKPLNESIQLWTYLISHQRVLFRRLFGKIALRHTKALIREELHLPPQKRVVVTLPFSAIESQNYNMLFNQMCDDVGVTDTGAPRSDEWNPDDPHIIEAMRTWLVRLRQTCLHPQVGGRNRKALGRGHGPLRTVAEVLEVMIEQNETSSRMKERALLSVQLQRAHILGNNREDKSRSEKALEVYEMAMAASADLVDDARKRVAAAITATVGNDEPMEIDDEETTAESTPLVGRLKNNLRAALQLQHVCTFFAATAVFQIKSNEDLTKPESEEFKQLEDREVSLYETAKPIRKEILIETSRNAERSMHKMTDLTKKRGWTTIPSIEDLQSLGGIESRKLVEKSDELFDVIRAQLPVIMEWRSKITEYLLKPLVDEDEGIETTGDEYEDSTKLQDELYVYMDAIRTIHADLNTFVTGESAPLIDHEVERLIGNVKMHFDPEVLEKPMVHAPELLLKLFDVIDRFRRRRKEVGSVRGLIQAARALEGSMEWKGNPRAEAERALVLQHLSSLQKVFSDYTKALHGLEKEIELFRNAQNQRLEFYRQLQELSDAVAPYKEELDEFLDHEALDTAMRKEEKHSKTLAQLKTKHRFLLNLRDESGSTDPTPKICVICQCAFENGVLTVCGHTYDKECIALWWRQHRTCPVCKRKLTSDDFHDITFKPQELRAQEEVHSGSSSASPSSPSSTDSATPSSSTSIYSNVDAKLLEQIKSIDLPTSYGTKIDTLGRHLHWLRSHDPGAKSIIFSQYRDFLDVLAPALRAFTLGFARLGKPGAVELFRRDPSIDCLLLDARTDSSGLTLVNATHVFVCEPLIQTAVELQAIARVHRIGQLRPTTVWMYLVADTVEEAIYSVSVARRLAHVQSSRQGQAGSGSKEKSRSTTPGRGDVLQETAIEAADSEELQAAPLASLLVQGKGGGEVVGKEDLWGCLFGKVGKDGAVVEEERQEVLEREMEKFVRAEAAERRIGEAKIDSQPSEPALTRLPQRMNRRQ